MAARPLIIFIFIAVFIKALLEIILLLMYADECVVLAAGYGITLSDDAWAAADKVDSHTFYLDMQAAKKSGDKNPPQTPYTPSVSLMCIRDRIFFFAYLII